jgi:hypothetical protein
MLLCVLIGRKELFYCETLLIIKVFIIVRHNKGLLYTDVPPGPRVIRSKMYRGYFKPRIIPNAIYNVTIV